MKDKSYRDLPLGTDVAEYLRIKSKRLTPATQRDYESCLDKFVRFFHDKDIEAFEPPAGGRLIESFLAAQWGDRAPRTYNKNLSVVHDFFVWQLRRGALRADPTLTIERAKPRSVHRTTFNGDQRSRIMAAAGDTRERLALKLLLDYGLRKGALQNVRFEHFDFERRRIRIFTKGEKIHQLPIPDDAFWADLESLMSEPGAQPDHYLLCKQKVVSRRRRAATLTETLDKQLADAIAGARKVEREIATPASRLLLERLEDAEQLVERTRETAEAVVNRRPDIQMGEHGIHDLWYRILARAGIVEPGVTRGERLHKARHSAGQRVLDKTGNLKATQALLCHANIGTTGDNYVGWETEQLEGTMREVMGLPASES